MNNPTKSCQASCRFELLSLIAILICPAAYAEADEPSPLTIDSVLENMVSVGGNFHLSPEGRSEDLLLSPDGELVFYSATTANLEVNQWQPNYFLVPFAGGAAILVPEVSNGHSFRFSPSSKFISFAKAVDGVEQLHVYSLESRSVRQVTSHRADVGYYQWAPDEKVVFFVADDPRSAADQQAYERGANWFRVDEESNGRIQARWRNIWRQNLSGGDADPVSAEQLIVDEFDVSPDGVRIAFVARPDNRRNYPHTAELYVIDALGGNLHRLTENLAPEAFPTWSPDGTQIAFSAPDDKEYRLTKGYLFILNPDTLETRKLTAQMSGEIAVAHEWGLISTLVWGNDGKSLLVNEFQGMNANLYRIDIAADKMLPLTKAAGVLETRGISNDQTRIVYTYSNFTQPVDIYTSDLDGDNAVRLTDANPWVRTDAALADFRPVRWKSKDGLEIEGILGLPPGYTEGARVPLLLQVHGGPPQQFANEFYFDLHIYAGMGYAVLGANVRGSSGYGEPLLRALTGEVSQGEYDDLMTGVDNVIDAGIADPGRLAIRGWSWGGVLTSWTITQTNRFKAASVGAPVVSWLSEMGPGFNWDLTEWYMDRTHWEDPAGWREISSLTHVAKVTTPTILFHGDDDWYSSYNQSLLFYTGLRDVGKAPTRFISFPDRGHEIFDPWAQRARYREETSWIRKYLGGNTKAEP